MQFFRRSFTLEMFLQICLLFIQVYRITCKVYEELDIYKPDFNLDDLDVISSVEQNSTKCPGTTERLISYRYNWRHRSGDVVKDQINVVQEIDVAVETYSEVLASDLSLKGTVTVRKLLNCKAADDPYVVETIKKDYLNPPSTADYNFEHHNPKTIADGQPFLVDQRYFFEKKKGGFFIEAGAFDGENDATSLHFELKHGWSGLLIEPMPMIHSKLRKKNRKAWSIQTCLSRQNHPETINFSMGGSSEGTMFGVVEDSGPQTVKMQCLPLYSILLALGNPVVDFFSLDIEGSEYQVLKSIPWDKVDIRALSVETQFAGEVTEGSREDIINLLTSLGYVHLDRISRDDIFVKLEPQGLSPKITFEEVFTRSAARHCVYFRVPGRDLASHCKRMFPRDFYMDQTPDYPDCLTKTICPADFQSLVATIGNRIPWPTLLSDSCQFHIMDSRVMIV